MLYYGILIFSILAPLSQGQDDNSLSPVLVSPVSGLLEVQLNDDTPSKTIRSPGDDLYYPPNVHVYYNVSITLNDRAVELGARIRVTFEMFALQESKYCTEDGLEITEPGNKVTVFCGSQSGEVFLSRSNKLEMRFFSDQTIEERGFSLLVDIYRSPCAKTLGYPTSNGGIISSPGFHNYYQNNELCVWQIQAPPGKKVRLGFNDVFGILSPSPFCFNDYLAISKTGDFDTDNMRYCGREVPAPIISEGQTMLVKFSSDCCQELRGFSASYSFVEIEVPPIPEPIIPSNCNCGKENLVETRVVDGTEVTPKHRYPWMASFHNAKLGLFCGAAIISNKYILTAAHCVHKMIPSGFTIIVGGHDKSGDGVETQADKIIIHPEFNPVTFVNDIALVRTEGLPSGSPRVSPVCLPPVNFNTTGRVGVVAGWGKTKEGGDESDKLLEGTMDALPLAECKNKYGASIIENHLCAQGRDGTDACQGDSGGPLFSSVDKRAVQIGVVSWGIGCGRDGYPGIFSKVSSFMSWIEQNTLDAPPPCSSAQEQKDKPLQPNLDNCGLANHPISSRVVGGYPTYNLEYPWLGIVQQGDTYVALGALISSNFFVTSAHWITNSNPRNFRIIMGKYNITRYEAQSRSYAVKSVNFEPNFNRGPPPNHDMAIFELSDPVEETFRPICLPRAYETLRDGSPLYAAGWGKTSPNSGYSDVLREIGVKKISQKECQEKYPVPYAPWRSKVTDAMVCAGAEGKGLCYGDVGAPLMAFYQGRYYLNGLSSWGSDQGCAVQPDVYSSVHKSLAWISRITELQVALAKP